MAAVLHDVAEDTPVTLEQLRELGFPEPVISAVAALTRRKEEEDYFAKELRQERIILVAHSFRSMVGLRMVEARPDLFLAYVGTGQVADEARNYAVAYQEVLHAARWRVGGTAAANIR